MESLQNILNSVRDAFYQLKDNIIGWFQSLRGGVDQEISDDNKMPEPEAVVTGPASRTRSTSIMAPDFLVSAPGLYPENNSNSQNFNEEEKDQDTSDSSTSIEECINFLHITKRTNIKEFFTKYPKKKK